MTMPIKTLTTKLELHYFFSDSSHAMDAFVRNKCENELLSIINEVARLLDINVRIDSEAYKEGGLRDLWNLIGKNNNQITILLVIITLILSRIPTTNKELENLQIEESKLSIEEKRLNIEKLKIELKREKESNCHDLIEGAIEDINSQLKVLKHKSNFYTKLVEYKKVVKICASRLTDDYKIVDDSCAVERRDFDKFILKTDVLPSEIDEGATIEIISPVLVSGNFKWKGIYNDEIIIFYMKDSEFRNSVIAEGIKFKNGTFIECVLEKSLKIDDFGEVVISGYSVITVIRKFDDLESIDTKQGKRYFKNKKLKGSQQTLFDTKE